LLMAGERSAQAAVGGEAGALQLYSLLQEKYESLLVRLGHLESAEQERRALAARGESLVAAEARARAEADEQKKRSEEVAADASRERDRADQLGEEVKALRRRLMWRTISLEILLLGVAGISAVIWLTQWWPW